MVEMAVLVVARTQPPAKLAAMPIQYLISAAYPDQTKTKTTYH